MLCVGTFNGVWYVGFDKDLGLVEVGKFADFVVFDKNLF